MHAFEGVLFFCADVRGAVECVHAAGGKRGQRHPSSKGVASTRYDPVVEATPMAGRLVNMAEENREWSKDQYGCEVEKQGTKGKGCVHGKRHR